MDGGGNKEGVYGAAGVKASIKHAVHGGGSEYSRTRHITYIRMLSFLELAVKVD